MSEGVSQEGTQTSDGAHVNDWAELDRALAELAVSGSVEVREDGEWLAELAALHRELHPHGKSSLLHLWSSERNLTRRVLRVQEQSADRIVLEVQRFGRTKPGRLEFLRIDAPRLAGRITREQFRARLRRILAEHFPDAEIEGLTIAPDLEHSFSGIYVRGRMEEAQRVWALLAAAPSESSAAVEGSLAFGLLWLDWTRAHAGRRAVAGLRLFIPEGTGRALRERVMALSSAAHTEIYEFCGPELRLEKVDPADAGNLESWLVPRREIDTALRAAEEAIARVRGLAPGTAHLPGDIGVRVPAGTNEVALLFRGLEFARRTSEGLFFGLGEAREKLNEATEARLGRLLRELDLHRSSLATDTNHPLYRAVPERWLETLVREDPARLDAQLDPRHLYSQVPAVAAGDRGVVDLLGVTRGGRLVVIELKASEDIQMPVQAMDYWLRVRRHERQGDFERYGYFPGVALLPEPPLVWLVAPGLQFHPATDCLLKHLAPEICIARIGLNENWRRGLKIVFRQ